MKLVENKNNARTLFINIFTYICIIRGYFEGVIFKQSGVK